MITLPLALPLVHFHRTRAAQSREPGCTVAREFPARPRSDQVKYVFATWLRKNRGVVVDPDTIFDCQVKRIHEYKRQLLGARSGATFILPLRC